MLLEPTASFEWTQCSPLPQPRKHLQAIEVKGQVYIGSGYGRTDEVSYEVYCYVPATNQWNASSNSLTCCFAMASFDEKVVLVGGKEKNGKFSQRVQVLMPDGKFENSEQIQEMPTARAGSVAASLAFNMVVAGGYISDKYRTKTVEVFDRLSKMWYHAADLPKPCAELKAAIAHGNQWYLLGGSNQYKEVFTISLQELEGPIHRALSNASSENGEDSSDPMEKWKTVANLPYDFSFVSVYGGCLVAMGGEKEKILGSEYSPRVYVYNHSKNEWLYITDLPSGRSKSVALSLPTGELLVIGGRSSAGRELDSMYKCKLACPM